MHLNPYFQNVYFQIPDSTVKSAPVATSQTFVSSQTTSSTNRLNLTLQSSQNLTSTANHPITVQSQDFAQTQKLIPGMDPTVNSRPSLTNGNLKFLEKYIFLAFSMGFYVNSIACDNI